MLVAFKQFERRETGYKHTPIALAGENSRASLSDVWLRVHARCLPTCIGCGQALPSSHWRRDNSQRPPRRSHPVSDCAGRNWGRGGNESVSQHRALVGMISK
ncbi:hypothetical protein IscW_ISCW019967 [Ixodes scapularis]|uniref:Uncharacterized protein n=1 Tax=Ixodes scapularis TaxID=6945 RepID=B7PV19_IXOSC|nr:hypothetical protein IscW_ISCW019967 [Ixodes scapularis]|eukprot:XP_002407154.1 hypothetical protein IscW_ISCW019967 [Ixodes scapularis]